jgi:hypothetical protein
MTLAAPLCPPRGVIDPIGVARREVALLQVVCAHPGATLPEIVKIAEGSRGAVIDRLKRLAARGAVVKVGGRWRLVGEEPEEPAEAALPNPEPEDPSRWVRPIGRYPGRHGCARFARREDLIRDFIVTASKMHGDALVNSEPKMPEIVDLYAMVSRMRALTMPRLVACAEKVMDSIIETYFAPNRTVADLREIVKAGQGVGPLKDFSEAAREELHAFAPV